MNNQEEVGEQAGGNVKKKCVYLFVWVCHVGACDGDVIVQHPAVGFASACWNETVMVRPTGAISTLIHTHKSLTAML